MRVKKSVKYNFKTAINDKGCKAGGVSEAAALEITEQKHDLSALKALVRRFLLISLLKERRCHGCVHGAGKAMKTGRALTLGNGHEIVRRVNSAQQSPPFCVVFGG